MGQMYGIDTNCSRVVVHFLKVVNETTGGYREFAVWREKHITHEKNIVLVCGTKTEGSLKEFSGIEVIWGNGDIKRIRKKIKEILLICRKKGIPIVFHIQQPTVIVEVMSACAGLGIRKNMLYTMKSTFSGYAVNKIKKMCIAAALYAKHVTFLSYASYEDYPRAVKWIKHNNISVIEHGADGSRGRIDWEERKARPKSALELVYTARIVPVKNHKFLLDVIEKVDRVHISFVGEEQQPAIQNEIKRRHLESKITITGLVNREEVYRILRKGDVYISSSTVEGLPVSVLEAMHAGLPIILSDIKPHIELAQKTDGIIVCPLQKELWIKELNRIKELKIEELAALGEKNAETAKRLYTLVKMHRRYSRLYRSLE